MKFKPLFVIIFFLVMVSLAFVLTRNKTSRLTIEQATQTPQTQIASAPTCSGKLTPTQTEGPYYTPNSPEKSSFQKDSKSGENIIVTGYVFDSECKPIANAWLDFWQADASGQYDNVGFTLRGHQFTSAQGQYKLETIKPAAYESRPPHIHVKVRTNSGEILTSQLYFPDEKLNESDSIFNSYLIMKVEKQQDQTLAQFNFVIPN